MSTILNRLLSFNEAREACQAKGGQWDLVVFESDEELEYVKKLINCLPEAFWVGYRENNGIAIDILNKVKSGYFDRILCDQKLYRRDRNFMSHKLRPLECKILYILYLHQNNS